MSSQQQAAGQAEQNHLEGRLDARPMSDANAVRLARGPLFAVLLLVAVWRGYADRHYWIAAWDQRTLLPVMCDCTDCIKNRETVEVAWQRPSRPSFDLSKLILPAREVLSGGVPKDGIPALTNPKVLSAKDVTYLKPADRVIGVVSEKQARAYPLKILEQHEGVNDKLGELSLAVTYCPLCDSAAAFDRRLGERELEFGVSGLLYNSNVLMYDRGGKPESLWSQMMATGVSGPAVKKTLTTVPIEVTTWKNWTTRHPGTTVLSADTGHGRDYSRSPYEDYYRSPRLMFPVRPLSDRLPAKTPVLGVWTDKGAKAFPLSAFGRESKSVDQEIDGHKFTIQFDPDAKSLRVTRADDGVSWMYAYWFAWYAFRPKTEVYR